MVTVAILTFILIHPNSKSIGHNFRGGDTGHIEFPRMCNRRHTHHVTRLAPHLPQLSIVLMRSNPLQTCTYSIFIMTWLISSIEYNFIINFRISCYSRALSIYLLTLWHNSPLKGLGRPLMRVALFNSVYIHLFTTNGRVIIGKYIASGVTQTGIKILLNVNMRIKCGSKAYFSGLSFSNELGISNSGPTA